MNAKTFYHKFLHLISPARQHLIHVQTHVNRLTRLTMLLLHWYCYYHLARSLRSKPPQVILNQLNKEFYLPAALCIHNFTRIRTNKCSWVELDSWGEREGERETTKWFWVWARVREWESTLLYWRRSDRRMIRYSFAHQWINILVKTWLGANCAQWRVDVNIHTLRTILNVFATWIWTHKNDNKNRIMIMLTCARTHTPTPSNWASKRIQEYEKAPIQEKSKEITVSAIESHENTIILWLHHVQKKRPKPFWSSPSETIFHMYRYVPLASIV